MFKAIAGSLLVLVVILVLTRMQSGHPGLDPHDQLTFEKQRAERRKDLAIAKTATPPELDCAASKVSRATVDTLYVVWVNNRPDLATPQDRDDASRDLAQKITACGAEPGRVEDEAHQAGLELEASASVAMLKSGR